MMFKWNVTAAAVLAGMLTLAAGSAQANLVQNGNFSSNGGVGQLGINTFATDWSVPASPNSYAFVFTYADATAGTVPGQYGNLGLWTNGNNGNGLTGTPNGSQYFFGMDSSFQQGALSQTINGLVAGQQYTVSFWWAGAQQLGFGGGTSDQIQVSFGNSTQDTSVVNVASEGFSGWMKQSFTFTANGSSDLLSFLALGQGGPPFALLDGIQVNRVPEPGTDVLLVTGLVALGGLAWRRRAAAKKTAPKA